MWGEWGKDGVEGEDIPFPLLPKRSLTNARLHALLSACATVDRQTCCVAVRIPGAAATVTVFAVFVVTEIASPPRSGGSLTNTNVDAPKVIAGLGSRAIGGATNAAILLASSRYALALVFACGRSALRLVGARALRTDSSGFTLDSHACADTPEVTAEPCSAGESTEIVASRTANLSCAVLHASEAGIAAGVNGRCCGGRTSLAIFSFARSVTSACFPNKIGGNAGLSCGARRGSCEGSAARVASPDGSIAYLAEADISCLGAGFGTRALSSLTAGSSRIADHR